ncbi:MAG: WecB/TagA/CpsF family glycosyltransferase [Clostridiales bacterium]|jgi:N-acetylglucosaminyldiphosphoundecaprenol N-acetyl-beta-D-mannosaminyltransferase|nr:WecB/TagA/CpsF family glycosyltransferase [Clostridiales bacterium]
MINIGRKTVYILGVKIDDITFSSSVSLAERLIKSEGLSMIYTINPEIIMSAYKETSFKDILNSSTLCVADGIGILYASKILNTPLPERISGIDLICSLFDKIKTNNTKTFLLGSKPGIAEKAKYNIENTYKGIDICGVSDGYFFGNKNKEDEIIEKINNSEAKLLIVCMGSPLQEKWINKNRNKLKVNLCIGAGGTLDVFSGIKKRAPIVMQNLNLEWFYRIFNEPKRIKRFMSVPKFAYLVILESLHKNKK